TGYEIHMGKTQSELDGQVVSNNNTYGTYVHGIFDEGEISQEIINSLCRKKGIPLENIDKFDIREYKEQQYDKLAQAVRSSLDMKEIYRILNSGI
ncbi:MAG: cobyric acid synthase CobQ, partial [Oscillospiraceae bacterium]